MKKEDYYLDLLNQLSRFATWGEIEVYQDAHRHRDWDTCHYILSRYPAIKVDPFER